MAVEYLPLVQHYSDKLCAFICRPAGTGQYTTSSKSWLQPMYSTPGGNTTGGPGNEQQSPKNKMPITILLVSK